MLWSFTVLTVLVLASAFRLTYFGAPILPVEAWIPAFELDLPRGCMGQPIGTPGENAYTLVYAVGETVMGHLVLTVVALVCMLILAIGHGRRACGGAAYRVAHGCASRNGVVGRAGGVHDEGHQLRLVVLRFAVLSSRSSG